MTETAARSFIFRDRFDRDAVSPLASPSACGMQILDSSGKIVPRGQAGELCTRGTW